MGKVAYLNRCILMDNLHIPSSGSTTRALDRECACPLGSIALGFHWNRNGDDCGGRTKSDGGRVLDEVFDECPV
jgi:hypothetical protein